jgi:hypothetical protein
MIFPKLFGNLYHIIHHLSTISQTISQVRQDSDLIPPGLSLARPRLSASVLRAALAPEAAEAAANAALAAAEGVAKALLLWRWQRLQMALEMETWKARRLEEVSTSMGLIFI